MVNKWYKRKEKLKKQNELRIKKDEEKRLKRLAKKRELKNKRIKDAEYSNKMLNERFEKNIIKENTKKESNEQIIKKMKKNKEDNEDIKLLFYISHTSSDRFIMFKTSIDEYIKESEEYIKDLKYDEDRTTTRRDKDIIIVKVRANILFVKKQTKKISDIDYYNFMKRLSKLFNIQEIELEINKYYSISKEKPLEKVKQNISYDNIRIRNLRKLCFSRGINIKGDEGRKGYINLLNEYDKKK